MKFMSKITTNGKPGKNENIFLELMLSKFDGIKLTGKKRYASDGVVITTDQSFIHKGCEYLIEIDSGNMAKLLVGQYVLINQLYEADKTKAVFIVVHAYKGYNPQRTTKNLDFVNKRLYLGNGIRFKAIHINDIINWQGGDLADLLSMID